jgi:hypothetical protein
MTEWTSIFLSRNICRECFYSKTHILKEGLDGKEKDLMLLGKHDEYLIGYVFDTQWSDETCEKCGKKNQHWFTRQLIDLKANKGVVFIYAEEEV